jgi:hypothetical protein
MYKVQYKSLNASQAWSTIGSYGSEAVALQVAERVAATYRFMRVIDADGMVVYSL